MLHSIMYRVCVQLAGYLRQTSMEISGCGAGWRLLEVKGSSRQNSFAAVTNYCRGHQEKMGWLPRAWR